MNVTLNVDDCSAGTADSSSRRIPISTARPHFFFHSFISRTEFNFSVSYFSLFRVSEDEWKGVRDAQRRLRRYQVRPDFVRGKVPWCANSRNTHRQRRRRRLRKITLARLDANPSRWFDRRKLFALGEFSEQRTASWLRARATSRQSSAKKHYRANLNLLKLPPWILFSCFFTCFPGSEEDQMPSAASIYERAHPFARWSERVTFAERIFRVANLSLS